MDEKKKKIIKALPGHPYPNSSSARPDERCALGQLRQMSLPVNILMGDDDSPAVLQMLPVSQTHLTFISCKNTMSLNIR